jgi:hypothetical protein
MLTNPEVTARILSQSSAARVGLLGCAAISKMCLAAFRRRKSVIVPGLGNKINLLLIRYVPSVIRMHVLVRVFRREMKEHPPSAVPEFFLPLLSSQALTAEANANGIHRSIYFRI